MKKNTKGIVVLVAAIVILAIIVGILAYRRFAPNNEKMKLSKYFNAGKEEVVLLLNDTVCEEKGKYIDGRLYVPYSFVEENLNHRFYWDKNENVLLYSTPNAVISAELDSRDCYRNNSKDSKEYEIVKSVGESTYVAAEYVQEHTAMEYKEYNNPKRVIFFTDYDIEKDYVKTEDDSVVRYKPSIKSPILADVKEGSVLRLLEKENKETGFCKVLSKSGITGYIDADDLGKAYKKTIQTTFQKEVYTHILKDEKINLVWHQVTNQSANSGLLSLLGNTKGVNVVCPTWFATSDNDGNIDSLASDNYVAQAHRQGVEVWGLCNDFSPNMKIGKVLEKTSTRQKLAKNLCAEAIRYSLDGINIDFENVKKNSGKDFVQFIRELGIMCRNNGIVLSIDNYPVRSYNRYYDRKEQAAVADYVITMAYDEYYAGSEEAGPVSSITYVTEGTELTLEEVPKNQSVTALPFYCRRWEEKTKNGKTELSSEAYSMTYAQTILQDAGTQAKWDDETKMNYLEYTKGKSLFKMWIEDISSLEEKIKAVAEYDTAGIAFWKLGMEDGNVWDVVSRYNK